MKKDEIIELRRTAKKVYSLLDEDMKLKAHKQSTEFIKNLQAIMLKKGNADKARKIINAVALLAINAEISQKEKQDVPDYLLTHYIAACMGGRLEIVYD